MNTHEKSAAVNQGCMSVAPFVSSALSLAGGDLAASWAPLTSPMGGCIHEQSS